MLSTEIALAAATWVLAIVTLWFGLRQLRLASNQLEAFRMDASARERFLREELLLRTQLTFMDRFDGSELRKQRSVLASYFIKNVQHDLVKEHVLEFFEDLGLFLRRGYLDEELVWSTFGYYAVRWWKAAYDYIDRERTDKKDPEIFADFQELTKRFQARDLKKGLSDPTTDDVNAFLNDEYLAAP
jgi:hypothetical protein